MEIDILARADALRSLGVRQIDFDAALEAALDQLAEVPPAELPAPHHIPIWLLGKQHHLGDVARIDVRIG
jgi:hypothetical protein